MFVEVVSILIEFQSYGSFFFPYHFRLMTSLLGDLLERFPLEGAQEPARAFFPL